MSKETMEWLNRNVLIGYTEKRGEAWHYRASDQGDEPNHYPGPIPVEEIRRRIFNWTPLEGPVSTSVLTADGVLSITDDSRKVIVRPDTQEILGVFKSGYQVHGYDEWLIKHVESILDADLHIGSAGLLRGGAVAWVQTELADTLEVEGVEFRPFLTAATSLDGSLATTYQTGAQLVVCDNTLQAALGSDDADRLKIRHSRHSLGRISDVRDALKIIHTASDEFAREVETLTAQTVSDRTWAKFVDAFSAPKIKKGAEPTKRQLTSQTKIGDTLKTLYANDNRVAPWAGTAYGVVAAVNTYQHHEVHTAGRSKAERNAEFTVTGRWAKNTADTLELLASVN